MYDCSGILKHFLKINKSSEVYTKSLNTAGGQEYLEKAKIFLIRADGSSYVMKFFPNSLTKLKKIETSLMFQHHLYSKNIPVSKIFYTNMGELFHQGKNGEVYTLQSFVPSDSSPVSIRTITAVAEQIGNLHKISSKFFEHFHFTEQEYPKPLLGLLTNALGELSSKQDLSSRNINCLSNFFSNCISKVNSIWFHSDYLSHFFHYIHGDFNNNNILILNQQVSGIIDFDNARLGDPLDDIIRFLLHISIFRFQKKVYVLEDIDPDLIQTFLLSYLKVTKLPFLTEDRVWKLTYTISIELTVLMMLRGYIIEYASSNQYFNHFEKISSLFAKEVSACIH